MSISGTRAGRTLSSIAVICVLAGAAAALAAGAEPGTAEPAVPERAPSTADIAGRWQGASYVLSAKAAADCNGNGCNLVLDISRCATGWCGVEVAQGKKCGATALHLDAGSDGNGNTLFKGKLELARGTEPYVVEAYLLPPGPDDANGASDLEIVGDTGGEFRMFRRTFPFSANLARSGDPVCKPETSVSLLE